MERVSYTCPLCQASILASANLAGECAPCPKCGKDVDTWPAPSKPAPHADPRPAISGQASGVNSQPASVSEYTASPRAVRELPKSDGKTPKLARHSYRIGVTIALVALAIVCLTWVIFLRNGKSSPVVDAGRGEAGGTGGASGNGDGQIPRGTASAPVYYVILTRGAEEEKLVAALNEMFPEALVEQTSGDSSRIAELIERRRISVAASLPKETFATIQGLEDKEIRFRGFNRDATDKLRSVIEREGAFTTRKPPADPVPGSLLQTGGCQQALEAAGLAGDATATAHLHALKDAILDVTAYSQALYSTGGHPAIIIQIHRDRQPRALSEFEEVHKKIISRFSQPLVTPLPLVAVYSAFDPKTTSGDFNAMYVLKLPVKCYWRLVGAEDRKNMTPLDFEKTSPDVKNQMQWRAFDAGRQIGWTPAGVRAKGRTQQIVSFDIAIPSSGGQVVIFSNQILYSASSRKDVQAQVTEYLTDILKIPSADLRDAYEINDVQGRCVATINYANLARSFDGKVSSSQDWTISKKDQFDERVMKENAKLK